MHIPRHSPENLEQTAVYAHNKMRCNVPQQHAFEYPLPLFIWAGLCSNFKSTTAPHGGRICLPVNETAVTCPQKRRLAIRTARVATLWHLTGKHSRHLCTHRSSLGHNSAIVATLQNHSGKLFVASQSVCVWWGGGSSPCDATSPYILHWVPPPPSNWSPANTPEAFGNCGSALPVTHPGGQSAPEYCQKTAITGRMHMHSTVLDRRQGRFVAEIVLCCLDVGRLVHAFPGLPLWRHCLPVT